MTIAATPEVNTRTLLLPYTLGLIGAMTVVQIVIAATGGGIGLVAEILTAIVALGIVAWLWLNRSALHQVRFGTAIAHALAYAAVCTSFNLHLLLRTLRLAAGPDGFTAAATDFFATGWFGATLVMTSVWGLGLLLHLVGSVLGRGWDD